MKKLTNLKGVKPLNKNEQKQIKGGHECCIFHPWMGWLGECCNAL